MSGGRLQAANEIRAEREHKTGFGANSSQLQLKDFTE